MHVIEKKKKSPTTSVTFNHNEILYTFLHLKIKRVVSNHNLFN